MVLALIGIYLHEEEDEEGGRAKKLSSPAHQLVLVVVLENNAQRLHIKERGKVSDGRGA